MINRIEGEEYNEIKHEIGIFDEIHRTTQRQFEWQRGFSSVAQIYRYAFLFSGPHCSNHLLSTHGYTFNDLSLFCLGVRTLAQSNPQINRRVSLQEVFLSAHAQQAIVNRISINAAAAVPASDESYTYSKSVLRQFPLIFSRDLTSFHVPLPEIVLSRSTTNSFYDFAGATGEVRNEMGKNFERYATHLMRSMLLNSRVESEFKYVYSKNEVASPDIMCYINNSFPDIIFECKSARMSFDAKFSTDPLKTAAIGYNEMAKAILQIWRYVSRRRILGLPAPRSTAGTIGIVLTLDSWLTMSTKKADVFELAYKMAATDAKIDRRDDVPIIFCSIDDLETILHESNERDFYKTVVATVYNRRYRGWLLPVVRAHLSDNKNEDNPYPFEDEIGNLLPWWKTMRDIEAYEG